METNYNNIPTYNQSIESIERLKKIRWPIYPDFNDLNSYMKAVEDIIFEEFKIIPEGLRFLLPRDFQIPVFRARELSSIKNIELIPEHSYPPIKHTVFQRCNFPQHPVFYCSDNPITSLLEISQNSNLVGKEFCLTKWNLKKEEKRFCVQNYLHSKIHNDNPFQSIRDSDILQLEKSFKFHPEKDLDKKRGLLELFKFLHEVFISDKNYNLSAALAHRSLYSNNQYRTDILIYPSVQTKLKGINMAINPNFVDNQMYLKRLYLVKVESYNSETDEVYLKWARYGVVKNQLIIWKNILDNESEFKKLRLIDFGGIVKN